MSPRPERLAAFAAAGAAGAAAMSLELLAVRALAPWFGTSLPVWTNVLGVVLLALALGYGVGARLASRARPLAWLGALLLAAAAWSAALPWIVAPAARWFRPDEILLHQTASLVSWGSLAASLCVFLPPAALLGAVQPLAVEVLARAAATRLPVGFGGAGRAGGAVLAVSTAGSLLGVFATTHWMIPSLGLRTSYAALAGLLALASFLPLFRGSGRRAASGLLPSLAVPLLACASFLAPHTAAPRPGGGRIELAARQSAYQFVRAVADPEGGRRYFQVNEGADSYQSAYAPELGLLGEGYYYDFFALPAWWTQPRPERWRVLVLGFGAGTVARVLAGASPSGAAIELTGVELDPAAVELGREYLGLGEAESRLDLRVHAGSDARAALRGLHGTFDLVVLDAYANQVEIPFHLCTREFFAELRPLVADGGWLAANIGGFGLADPVVLAVGETLASSWDTRVLALSVPTARNAALYARPGAEPPAPGSAAFALADVGDGALERALASLVAPLALPSAWRWIDAAAAPLTDDRSPIEMLQAASLARAERAAQERVRARSIAGGGGA